ncbi:hypothetical protein N3Z17_07440 (plasmid) [Candidatus Bandiella numerosa]|nr:hypothetical protein [Candidatus Bandiella numerosa]WHA05665.1 hypothetical protein N3Z17_07440 [Candidatus Bandiella numerosa]
MEYLGVMIKVYGNLLLGKSRKELGSALQCVILVISNITIKRGTKCI